MESKTVNLNDMLNRANAGLELSSARPNRPVTPRPVYGSATRARKAAEYRVAAAAMYNDFAARRAEKIEYAKREVEQERAAFLADSETW